MEKKGVNMQDVRKCLGVKSVGWEIEKRILERIWHVMRTEDERFKTSPNKVIHSKRIYIGMYQRHMCVAYSKLPSLRLCP